jgi:serine/threonine-protein kinase
MTNNKLNASNDDRSSPTEENRQIAPTVMANGLNAQYLEQTINYWPPGKQLEDGKYTLVQKLGSGGFGITYLAEDNRSGDRVVIKALSTDYIPSDRFERFRKDFLNEAVRLAKCCHHPHIVRIIELIEEQGLPCIVMDYIPGQDLEKLANPQKLAPEKAWRYIQQIGEALTSVHQQGLLHRDVKPKNIIVRPDTDEAVLIDFGIAREYDPNAGKSLTAFMSGGYTPIEQIYPDERENKPGFYTDVYGLAATFYYLVTGKNPEDAQNRVFSLSSDRADSLVNPRTVNPNISAGMAQAILQGLALYPQDRPQTIQEWFNLIAQSSQTVEPDRTIKVDATQRQISSPTHLSTQTTSKQNESKTSRVKLLWIVAGSIGALAFSILAVLGLQKVLQNSSQVELNSNSTTELNPQSVSKYSNYGIGLSYPKDWTIKEYEPNEFTQIVAELTPRDRTASEAIQPKLFVEVRQLTPSLTSKMAAQEAIAEIQKYLPDAKILENRQVKLDAQPAYLLVYTGLDGQNPLQRMQVGVLKNEKLYILTYEAKSDRYKIYEPTVQAIVDSFKFLP